MMARTGQQMANDQMRNALVVVAHSDPASFNHALSAQVAQTWSEAGLTVTVRDLHAERFDPVLTLEEQRGAPSRDPLVQSHIAALRAADVLAVVHPNCWGAPAIMKGWIDRVFAPNAAYAFEKGEDAGDAPVGLLTTRAALVLNTGNTRPERERALFGDPLERMWRSCILEYCGIPYVERALFGVVATSGGDQRAAWLAEAERLARAVLVRVAQPAEN
jgi:NAD(P)H dehydrogenase (quinone)